MIRVDKDIITKIGADNWYTTSDIIKHRFVVNSRGDTSYMYVWRLINDGKLPARNFSPQSKRPYYMVRGADLIEYIKKHYF